jgi:hypothetical protein
MKSFSTNRLGICLGLTALAAWFGLGTGLADAAAARTLKFQITCKNVKRVVIPLGDVAGHAVGLGVRQGSAAFSDGRQAKYRNVFTFEAWGRGRVVYKGYTRLSFKDGSWIYVIGRGKVSRGPGGVRRSGGVGILTRGAGRFKGIKGKVVFKAGRTRPGGVRVINSVMTYTLPK